MNKIFFYTVLGCIILMLLRLYCSDVCLNPDCKFLELKPPIVLTSKSFDRVTCIDNEGVIWMSSTGWNIAQEILVKGYSVGDTIVHSNLTNSTKL